MSDNLIAKILNCLDKSARVVAIKIYGDRSLEIKLWETEFPIYVELDKRKIYFETLCTDFQVNSEMAREIADVMWVLENSFEEMEEWFS